MEKSPRWYWVVFEGMKESWRGPEAWHCERPFVKVQLQDRRGHAKTLRLGARKRAFDRLLGKEWLSCSKGFWESRRCWRHKMAPKNSSSRGVEPVRAQKMSYVC